MNRGVEIRDLRKTFALARWQGFRRRMTQVTAVDGITLDVPAGQSVAFIGPNGAGKSTTIKILTGILHPSSGDVKVLGLTPWLERRKLAQHIGASGSHVGLGRRLGFEGAGAVQHVVGVDGRDGCDVFVAAGAEGEGHAGGSGRRGAGIRRKTRVGL